MVTIPFTIYSGLNDKCKLWSPGAVRSNGLVSDLLLLCSIFFPTPISVLILIPNYLSCLLLCSALGLDLCTCFSRFESVMPLSPLRILWWADCILIMLYSTRHWISCTEPLCIKRRKCQQNLLNIIRFYLKTSYELRKYLEKQFV